MITTSKHEMIMNNFTPTITINNTPDGHRLDIRHRLETLTLHGWIASPGPSILHSDALTVLAEQRRRATGGTHRLIVVPAGHGADHKTSAVLGRRK